ncbi:hypothetical protein ACOYR1_06785 [Thalassotalea piscium]
MKKIINQLKVVFNTNKQCALECNYANNYYGDQYCQVKVTVKD